MKVLGLVAIVLGVSLAACRKEEAIWNKLSDEDRAAITTRSYNECLSNNSEQFNNFQNTSVGVYSSSSWQRHDTWKHTFTNDSTVNTTKIRVWKNDGTNLYLAVSKEVGGETTAYFLRVPVSVNEDMIEDLREQLCRRFQITSSSGGSDGPLAVTYTYDVAVSGETHTYTDTYNFNFEHLAFTATEWNLKRRIVKKNSSGTQYDDRTWMSSLTELSGEADLSTDPATWSTTYCDIYEPLANATYTDLSYVLPYQRGDIEPDPNTTTCQTDGTAPAGWDMTL